MSIDDKVIALQQRIQEKRKLIEKVERLVWQTNSVIVSGGVNKNLQTIGTTEECVALFAEIVAKSEAYDKANFLLDSKIPFTHLGFSLGQWQNDFKTRMATISIVKEKKKLKDLETALESLESNEVKQNKILAGIEAELE